MATMGAEEPPMPYDIHLDVKHGPFETVDLGKYADAAPSKWWNQSLVKVNDCVVRVGVLMGEFHWHKHDREDEFFYVVEGKLFLDMEGHATAELLPRQGAMVPKGAMHRTRAPSRTVVLMIEAATVVPTGD